MQWKFSKRKKKQIKKQKFSNKEPESSVVKHRTEYRVRGNENTLRNSVRIIFSHVYFFSMYNIMCGGGDGDGGDGFIFLFFFCCVIAFIRNVLIVIS